jgi:hypothetical protein
MSSEIYSKYMPTSALNRHQASTHTKYGSFSCTVRSLQQNYLTPLYREVNTGKSRKITKDSYYPFEFDHAVHIYIHASDLPLQLTTRK